MTDWFNDERKIKKGNAKFVNYIREHKDYLINLRETDLPAFGFEATRLRMPTDDNVIDFLLIDYPDVQEFLHDSREYIFNFNKELSKANSGQFAYDHFSKYINFYLSMTPKEALQKIGSEFTGYNQVTLGTKIDLKNICKQNGNSILEQKTSELWRRMDSI